MQTMWLNHAIKTLWPVYNEAIAKMAMEQAKPQIDAALKGVSQHLLIASWFSNLPSLKQQEHDHTWSMFADSCG